MDHKNIVFSPKTCSACGQSEEYLLPIDNGTVDIVKMIARYIDSKGINVVHPRKEIEGHGLTSNQVGNLSRPRFHGLIARVAKGNYCLTTKGAKFLNGMRVEKYAIVSKVEKRNVGYLQEGGFVTVHDFNGDGEYWEGINYEIEGGIIIRSKKDVQHTLL